MSKAVGYGIFMWMPMERRSNRYGAFFLAASTYDESVKVAPHIDESELTKLLTKRVRVTCKVVESRESGHCGDSFLEIVPSKPEVGEVVDLGVAMLFMAKTPEGDTQVVMKPGDDRTDLWIDPRKLYRLHDQTVHLYVEPTEDDFTPAADLKLNGTGSVVVEPGAYQTKKAPLPTRGPVETETLGGGMFLIRPAKVGTRFR